MALDDRYGLNRGGAFSTAEAAAPLAPTYMFAGDVHDYANGSIALTDPTTWSEKFENMGRFVVSAAYSAGGSFINTGVAVNNWFGGDAQEVNVGDALYELDSDIGAYYQQNKQAADITGFIVSSFIPGLAGIKLLNAGTKVLRAAVETGKVGGTLGKAVGLLQPAEVVSAKAAAEFAASQATFTYINGNVLKSIALGAGGLALEGAAFETAVAVTMAKSPVLDYADGWDIAKNVAIGATLGGVFGAAFQSARVYGASKKAGVVEDVAEKSRTYTEAPITGMGPADRVILAAENLRATVPDAADASAKALRQNATRVSNLEGEFIANVRALIPGGTTADGAAFGRQVTAELIPLPADQVMANLAGAKQLGKMSQLLEGEAAATRAAAAGLNDSSLATAGTPANTRISFIRLTGDDAGKATDEYPAVIRLADSVKGGTEAVKTAIRSYGFTQPTADGKKLWTVLGSTVSHWEAEARYWWAKNTANVRDGMKLSLYDLPMQERLLLDWRKQEQALQELEKKGVLGEKINTVVLVGTDGTETVVTNSDDLMRSIRLSKKEAANALLDAMAPVAGKKGPATAVGGELEEIARKVNVRTRYLQGEQSVDEVDDLFAEQFAQRRHLERLEANGRKVKFGDETDLTLIPSYAKVSHSFNGITATTPYELTAAAYIEAQVKVIQSQVQNVFVKFTSRFGFNPERFQPIPQEAIFNATRIGAGPGVVSSAQGNYGSLESIVQVAGAGTADLQRAVKESTKARLEAVSYALAGDTEAAITFSAVSNQVASTAEHYIANPSGAQSLVLRSVSDYRDALARGEKNLREPLVQPGAPMEIPVENLKAWNAVLARIESVGGRTTGQVELRAAQGLENAKDARTFYPVRQNVRDYNHFFFVVDDNITTGSAGHVSMVHAASARELELLREKIPSQFRVYTKAESEKFHKDYGDYNYENTLHENYIDSALKRNGVNNAFFPQTDPQKIVTTWLDDELRADDILTREMVNAVYEKPFSELRRLGELYDNIGTSSYTGSYRFAESSVKNPYFSYVKTALNINQASENRFIYGLNQLADSFASRAIAPISDAFRSVSRPQDLDQINAMLQRVGAKSAFPDAATLLLANHSAPVGALSTFVRRGNAILANLTLGLDPLNALTNAIGMSVIGGTETMHIVGALARGDAAAVGKLTELMKVKIPGLDLTDSITSASKLIARGYQRTFDKSPAGLARRTYLESLGFNQSIQRQFDSMLDDLTLAGGENVGALEKRISQALEKSRALAEKGTLWSGNKLAESTNRLVSADVMLQLLEPLEAAGKISRREFPAYINSFVNRTQGSYLASQRPLIFQGPVGQAVGLFQTYQFNLLQQMFRYVSEGSRKDVAMLLGLQGTIFGLNGLPAFNFINTHIVGTASGNPNHRDLHTATYGIAGKEIGDWLLFGLPSNMLQTNLYTRGDINPRQPTIIPVNPADIPIVSATTKFLGNLKRASSRLGAGGDVWQTFLQGVEHQGLSRPLAGLAQVAQAVGNGGTVISTTNAGNILGSNDFFSIATLSRLAGGRPIDESIVSNAAFRTTVYQAADKAKRDMLKQAINTQVLAGGAPDQGEYAAFAEGYAMTGGDTKRFNKYMLQRITEANTPLAEKIATELKGPFAQNMQHIMGGVDITADNTAQLQESEAAVQGLNTGVATGLE